MIDIEEEESEGREEGKKGLQISPVEGRLGARIKIEGDLSNVPHDQGKVAVKFVSKKPSITFSLEGTLESPSRLVIPFWFSNIDWTHIAFRIQVPSREKEEDLVFTWIGDELWEDLAELQQAGLSGEVQKILKDELTSICYFVYPQFVVVLFPNSALTHCRT